MTFRTLTESEERDFRKWARENWKPGDAISEVWHPVVRDEIAKMQDEINADPANPTRAIHDNEDDWWEGD